MTISHHQINPLSFPTSSRKPHTQKQCSQLENPFPRDGAEWMIPRGWKIRETLELSSRRRLSVNGEQGCESKNFRGIGNPERNFAG